MSRSVFEAVSASLAAREAVVLASVTDTGGSTPRLAGAVMAVTAAAQFGTVGGGAFERHVIEAARALLADPGRATAVVDVHLVRDLGMCCGGRMTAFLNKQAPAQRLYVFGAGHVGTELCHLAERVGFEVIAIDGRADWADPARFPPSVQVEDAEPDDRLRTAPLPSDAYCVITTHSHELDERLVELLSAAPPAYVGLIGSRGKWARFRGRLEARGVPARFLDAVRCPVGLDIGAATPAEIAVSIVGELVATLRRAAPR